MKINTKGFIKIERYDKLKISLSVSLCSLFFPIIILVLILKLYEIFGAVLFGSSLNLHNHLLHNHLQRLRHNFLHHHLNNQSRLWT